MPFYIFLLVYRLYLASSIARIYRPLYWIGKYMRECVCVWSRFDWVRCLILDTDTAIRFFIQISWFPFELIIYRHTRRWIHVRWSLKKAYTLLFLMSWAKATSYLSFNLMFAPFTIRARSVVFPFCFIVVSNRKPSKYACQRVCPCPWCLCFLHAILIVVLNISQQRCRNFRQCYRSTPIII